MENLLYYPGFEVEDFNWLKFALLYVNKLRPIIPSNGDKYLSDTFKMISNETDLFKKYRPEYEEGYKATLDAINEIEKILSHPERYSPTFHTTKIDKIWRNSKKYQVTLFKDKYTKDFKDFLLENNIAIQTSEGLNLSKDLANIYMTIFAQAISDLRTISPITDISGMDRFSIFIRHLNKSKEESLNIAQKIITLKLPKNISHISFKEIIKLRNDKNFKAKLHTFQSELAKFLSSEEENKDGKNFIKKYNHIYSEFSTELLKFGKGLASFGMGVWLTTSAPISNDLEIAKKFLEGTAFLLSGVSISSAWKNTKAKRYCKKYLAEIEKISKAWPLH